MRAIQAQFDQYFSQFGASQETIKVTPNDPAATGKPPYSVNVVTRFA